MGRPINKRFFGETGNDANPAMPVRDEDGETYIMAQKGTNKFIVADNASSPPGERVAYLVDKLTGFTADEIALVGILDGSPVTIAKLFNRTAIDFSGNRYSWELQDDSTETLLILTAI